MTMTWTRRDLLTHTLLGTASLAVRSMVSGVPAAWLLSPRTALAQAAADCAITDPQFLVLSASDKGDPINANTPGSYTDAGVHHSPDPAMAATSVRLGDSSHTAALPWSTLSASVLGRATFFHHATRTNAHPNHPKVLALMGQTRRGEMLPSILAKVLAPCLGTIQAEPVAVGAQDSAELLRFEGRSLAALSPRALKTVLGSGSGPLANLNALQGLRDRDLNRMNALFKEHGTNVQRAFLDRLARSQREARAIPEELLGTLASITSNDVHGQILAASALIKMKVAPVVSLHIPFGGDNHADPDFADETEQTIAGVDSIGELMAQLARDGLADNVTFALLNVFGRTLISSGTGGRNHNPDHAVSLIVGSRMRAGVVGGLVRSGKDVAASPIDGSTGAAAAGGDISVDASLGALGKTLGAALGLGQDVLDQEILSGKVVRGALA